MGIRAMGVDARRRKTYRGRGFRLLGGTVCAVVVAVIAICTAISLSVISTSTRQTNEALESAVTAYDQYLQGLGGEASRTDGILEALDADSLLGEVAEQGTVSAAQAQALAERIASYEVAAQVQDAQARLYLYFPRSGRMVGSQGAGADPRDATAGAAFDTRLAQVEDALLVEGADDASFMVQVDDAVWHAEVGGFQEGVRYVMFLSIPELPSTEVLTPISEVCELYFADRYGHKYAYSEDPRFADVFEFSDLTGQGSSGFVGVEHDGVRYRCYYEDNSAGYNKFVLVTLDVVAAARRGFITTILLAGALLVLGGCLVGFLLTRHVYEPLQRIIDRLTPAGHRVGDEFALIGRALEGMEHDITEQREVIADFSLMCLLLDPSDDVRARSARACAERGEEAPFYLLEDASCTVLAVRLDRAFGGVSPESLRYAVEDYLAGQVVSHALCAEGPIVFAVLEARGLDVGALARGLLAALADDGLLVSVFTSAAYSGPTMLNAAWRETVRVMREAGVRGVFNEVRTPDSLPEGDERAHPTLGNSGLFEDMCAYIQGNYRDPSLSSGQLARRFGMSQASITRLFKQRTNGGFLDYVHDLRIQQAASLLASTDLPVAEVAERVGYGDASTMTRAFKRYRGVTPGEFRDTTRK